MKCITLAKLRIIFQCSVYYNPHKMIFYIGGFMILVEIQTFIKMRDTKSKPKLIKKIFV